jgi:hypothetical protein
MGPCVVSYLGEAATSPAPVAAFSWGFGFRPQISYVRFMPIAAAIASASPPGWLRCSIVTAHRMSPRAFGRYAPCELLQPVHLVFAFNSAADFREIPTA